MKPSLTYLKRVWVLARLGALSRSIQLLHLDQASIEHLIHNLAEDHSSSFKHGHMSP